MASEKKNNSFLMTAAGIAVALALVATIVSIIGKYHSDNKQARSEAVTADKGMPRPSLSIQCSLTHKTKLNCVSQQPPSNSESLHTTEALRAQQESAEWSLGSLLVTAAGCLLSAMGIIYVAATLKYTREAVQHAAAQAQEAAKTSQAAVDSIEIAREIGQAQTRCYLSVENGSFSLSHNNKSIFVNITIRNSGQSPARNVNWYPRFTIGRMAITPNSATCLGYRTTEDLPGSDFGSAISVNSTFSPGPTAIGTLGISSLTDQEVQSYTSSTDDLQIGVVIVLRYKDVFDISHTEEFRFIGGMLKRLGPQPWPLIEL